MRSALTIAGSDSSAGAGVQADLKTFAAFGVYAASAITAITAQSTGGIVASEPVSADLVTAQIETVAADLTIHATKTGMLATAAIVEAVAAAIEELELPLVVVDPVLVSTSGTRLLDEDGVGALKTELIPRAAVLTPNVAEAEALAGLRIRTDDDLREAARRLRALGAELVVITGGHGGGNEVVDLAFDGETFTELRALRVGVERVHGSGCAHASALAACLALGWRPIDAARAAQAYVAGGLRRPLAVGRGAAVLDHFWQSRR